MVALKVDSARLNRRHSIADYGLICQDSFVTAWWVATESFVVD